MFGTEITLLAAYFAGFLSFVSPCILPVVPVYIAMLAGADNRKNSGRRFVLNTVFFMVGFTVLFVLMGAAASTVGQLFIEYQDIVRKVGAVFMVLMGLSLSGILYIPLLSRDFRLQAESKIDNPLNAAFLGMAVTAGWTPCVGPILASVLAYAGIESTLEKGIYLLLAYSAGFATPFIIFALFCKYYLDRFYSWGRFLPLLQRIAGVILIAIGILMFFNLVQKWLGIISQIWL